MILSHTGSCLCTASYYVSHTISFLRGAHYISAFDLQDSVQRRDLILAAHRFRSSSPGPERSARSAIISPVPVQAKSSEWKPPDPKQKATSMLSRRFVARATASASASFALPTRHAFITASHRRAMSSSSSPKFQIALCQIAVGDNKQKNIATATAAVTKAVENGAKVVSLPECWNSPYATSSFPQYAEAIPTSKALLQEAEHPSTFALSQLAQQHQIYLVGGSIPEKDSNGGVYNTSVIFSPEGEILGKHRKVHLFDIDVPGKITFKESDTLSAGNSVTVFDTPYCKIGVGICYDIRFPELSMLMKKQGAKVLIFPGAFNLTTGPAHWELLQRGRAVDNQLYVAAASPARGPEGGYQAWGHSSVISPWGEVVATCGHDEAIVYAEIDLENVDEMRRNIPTGSQTRSDIYELVQKK